VGSVALVVVTDGRGDYLAQTVASLRKQLQPMPECCHMIDDSGDPAYRAMLHRTYGDEFAVFSHETRQGFVTTVRDAWTVAVFEPEIEYVFHAEDDFTYNEPVGLAAMADLLDHNPQLAQLALKRQPVNHAEREIGDITLVDPDAWVQHTGFFVFDRNFTTNPSLIPRRVIQHCLQAGVGTAEMELTRFLRSVGLGFGYLGEIDDPPRVHHIGEERAEGALYG
jgi:hypothetical protein